ncbi:MAG: family 10 glycosylhydrolase, partial [Bacteroidota bacterium]
MLFLAGFSLFACTEEAEALPPKHEFRAVWVASFHNIDWPSAKGLSASEQKSEYVQLLRNLQRNRMNALVVQIRSNGDAIYKSDFAPWSEYLSGVQGQAPEPYYDPLRFMVSAAHDRNLEFHAWFNPFRAIS